MSDYETIHVEPDTHVPFHDPRAWGLSNAVAADRQPDHFIKLGDWLDLYTLSSHQKDPAFRRWTFKKELEEANALLDEQDKILSHCKNKVYIFGNHEWRFDRYISQRAPELYNLTSISKELHLRKRGWKVVPYMESYRLGHVTYTHDTGSAGARAHLDAEQIMCDNVVIGHTHRLGYAVVGNQSGKPHVAAMMGWLGEKKYAKYLGSASKNRYWSQGFGTGIMDKNGVTYLTPHPIINYTACVDGHVYTQGA